MPEITLYRPGEASLSGLSTDELKSQLAASLEISAAHLMHLAAIWQELERRGEDLSALRSGIAVYLPMIARGELDANLVVRYAGQNMLLRHMASLPASEQARLIENDHITIVDFVDGDFIEREIALSEIDSRRLKDVFADHILSSEEQREAIARRRRRRHAKNRIVAQAMRDGLRAKRAPDEDLVTINVPLSPPERERLKAYVRDNKISLARLAKAAIMYAIK